MNWYYAEGQNRLGPFSEEAWAELVKSGKIQADTLVWNEGLEGWTRFSNLATLSSDVTSQDEPDGGLQTAFEVAQEEEESPQAYVARVEALEYTTSVSSCIERAWNLMKGNFGLLAGTAALSSLLLFVFSCVPLIGPIVNLMLNGVITGGVFYVFLRLMRGHSAKINDLFVGFSKGSLNRLMLTAVTSVVPTMIFIIPLAITAAVIGLTEGNFAKAFVEDPVSLLVFSVVALAASVPAVYLGMGWLFVVPLVMDKNLGLWQAMELSRRKVMQKPWKVSFIYFISLLIGASGFIALFIGVILTLPLYFAMLAYLYADIFAPIGKKD